MDELLQREWARIGNSRRIVVKIGSNLLTQGGERVRQEWIDARCAEIAALRRQGRQVIVVTSGAVAAGRPMLQLGQRPLTLREKQAAAAAGQAHLMRHYQEGFAHHGLNCAQILLTRDDVSDRTRYLNARDTFVTLLSLGLIPVVNENDTVVTLELRFGDNDTLGALVAGLVDADLLILLSDVDGLYDADPRRHPKAHPIPLVTEVTPAIEALAGGVGSAVASGGMITKLKAARKAARTGCPTILANGFADHPITRLLTGKPAGTLFLSQDDPINSRKRWIANGLPGQGGLHLDAGAACALLDGKSLLAKGIIKVTGSFERGAAVYCLTPEGVRIAKGLVNYNADNLKRIAGHHSGEFESILGFLADDEVIHRNNLVLLSKCERPHPEGGS